MQAQKPSPSSRSARFAPFFQRTGRRSATHVFASHPLKRKGVHSQTRGNAPAYQQLPLLFLAVLAAEGSFWPVLSMLSAWQTSLACAPCGVAVAT